MSSSSVCACNLAKSDYLSINDVAAASPGNPHVSTVWRWVTDGVRAQNGKRVFLDFTRVGRRIYVPRTALEAFFAELRSATEQVRSADSESDDSSHLSQPTTPRRRRLARRQRDHLAAMDELAAAGIA